MPPSLSSPSPFLGFTVANDLGNLAATAHLLNEIVMRSGLGLRLLDHPFAEFTHKLLRLGQDAIEGPGSAQASRASQFEPQRQVGALEKGLNEKFAAQETKSLARLWCRRLGRLLLQLGLRNGLYRLLRAPLRGFGARGVRNAGEGALLTGGDGAGRAVPFERLASSEAKATV